MTQKFFFIALFCFVAPLFALHCPNCGTKNHKMFMHCFQCGESLDQAREWMKQQKKESSSKVKTYRFSGSDSSNHSVPGNVPGYQRGNHTSGQGLSNSNPLYGGQGASLESIQKMLGSQGAKLLMGYQNKGVSQGDLQNLNSNPQVQQLMKQFKSTRYQKDLLKTLNSLGGPKDKKGQAEYQQQMKQLQVLFQMLNQQQGAKGGAGGLSGLGALLNP